VARAMFCKIFAMYITSWRVQNLNEGHTLKYQPVMPAQVFGPNGRLVACKYFVLKCREAAEDVTSFGNGGAMDRVFSAVIVSLVVGLIAGSVYAKPVKKPSSMAPSIRWTRKRRGQGMLSPSPPVWMTTDNNTEAAVGKEIHERQYRIRQTQIMMGNRFLADHGRVISSR